MNFEIHTYKKEYEEAKYQLERYQDFWEWYEDNYGETRNELWDKFEKWEDEKKRKN